MTSKTLMQSRSRRGFTLVELVVVVLIVGILAAIAAPKLFDTSTEAREVSTRQSLAVLRGAVELYKAKNGTYPGDAGSESDLKADLKSLIQGSFPRAEVGNPGDSVRVQSSGSALSASGTEGWAYDNKTGEIIVNHGSYSSW